jgi:uncharacterized protein (DUF2336 family)
MQMANDPRPNQRQALLIALTELFLEKPETLSFRTVKIFGEIFEALAFGLDADCRIWLAEQFANCDQAPYPLIKALAHEPFEVAGPLLQHSQVLTDADWFELLSLHGQAAVDIVANRSDLPIDICNALFFDADQSRRRDLIEQNAALESSEIDRILSQSAIAFHLEPLADHMLVVQARRSVQNLDNCGSLDVIHLVDLLRQGSGIEFCAALAHLSDLDFALVEKLLSDAEATGLAVLCKYLEFPKAIFSTILLLSDRARTRSPESASEILGYFSTLELDAAQKTIGFWHHFASPEDNVVAA